MGETTNEAPAKHTIPVIDRMMDVLGELEHSNGTGLTIRELTSRLRLPRTTVYRILNTLQRHEIVRRDDAGTYTLGRRLLTLAAQVASRASEIDVGAIAQPFLDKLATELGESVKLSVIDEDGILVLATSQGRREYALTVAPGQRMPIHAGAASKLLLAHLPPEAIDYWLSTPLTVYTNRTITDPKRLRSELARIRRQGWAQDKGENAPSIQAFAAPVYDRRGKVVAALSIPFLAGTEPSRMEELRMAAIETARAISEAMPASNREPREALG
ncbi:IclR family transcriptional regulator [Chelativorans sp. SCAU2101]|jgi:Transcriptional regulator|uniref:IclR family transcriptional regulator n=1 Tax=Chelativorans petroleitrophicus TaxID=2975484 RepID=A0A9X2X8N2_9HYPH|nr:IclR family transcriptional regulator [Chelativorans petroleitrophicus]MCT8990444.1 IclR family transcriptional regulator [Chelativorans petroleitrophicus]